MDKGFNILRLLLDLNSVLSQRVGHAQEELWRNKLTVEDITELEESVKYQVEEHCSLIKRYLGECK